MWYPTPSALDLPAFIVTAAMFAGAIHVDLKARWVSPWYWAPFLVVAACFTLTRVINGSGSWWTLLAVAAVYAWWRAGMMGGGDAKGLIVASFILPGAWSLAVLVVASAWTMFVPAWFFVVNVARGHWGRQMCLGLRYPTNGDLPRHAWHLESFTSQGVTRHWLRFPEVSTQSWQDLRDRAVTWTWVTPKVPFIVPLTISCITWITVASFTPRLLA